MKAVMRENSSTLGAYYAQLYNGEPFFEVFPASIVPFNFAGTSKFIIDRNKFEVFTGYTSSNVHPLSANKSTSSLQVSPSAITFTCTGYTTSNIPVSSTSVLQVSPSAINLTARTINLSGQGIVLPKMTAVQRDIITSPIAGLVIYNTDTNKLNFYNGTTWRAISDTTV
jgi:hypothetical protein